MRIPTDHDDQPTGPRTEQERELFALYAELEEPDRVLLWCALLTLLDQQSARSESAPVLDPQEPG